MTAVPTISVGMPVYNAQRYLRRSIGAVLAQTFGDFELIVSDNGSTDDSAAICEEFARRDPRVRLIRQPRNLGAAGNFLAVFDAARAPFFVWAAADDMRSPDFLEVNLDVLRRRPDVVASISPTRFDFAIAPGVDMGDAALDDPEPGKRAIAAFTPWFAPWHANARYYSLFRREALACSRVLRGEDYLASDWAVMLEVLARGKFARAEAGELVLGSSGDSSRNLLRFYRRSSLDHVLPLWRLLAFAIRYSRPFPLRERCKLRWRVFGLNFEANIGRFTRVLAMRNRAKIRRMSAK